MCNEAAGVIASISASSIRVALESGVADGDECWHEVVRITDTIGFAGVMALLDEYVDGPDQDGFSPGDVGRALERELRVLFCTHDSKYRVLRKEIEKLRESVRQIGVAVASAVAAVWHLSAGLLTPFVLVFLLGIAKVGVEAWCSGVPLESAT